MWRLWNKLFGAHYVVVRSVTMDYRYVRRVHKTAAGEMYVIFCGQSIWFLLGNGKVDNGYAWTPLTWIPESDMKTAKAV